MSETKFTPGNWEVHCGYLVRSCIGDECAPICDLQSPYRRFYGIVRASKEEWHNAHLIAAAPDMYAAICEFLRGYCDNPSDEFLAGVSDLAYKMRMAKNKAEGKGV